jgi:hypothetical protein
MEVRQSADPLHTRRLLARGTAKPLPDYIPLGLRNDYYEACRIADLSTKAAATALQAVSPRNDS